MVPDQDPILYASVSKGTTVLADFISGSGDGDIETLASQCLEKTPLFHLIYSHAIGKRIYCFLMEDPFVYFAIADESFGKPQSFAFLDLVKDAFLETVKNKPINDPDHLASRCFAEEFGPVFLRLIHPQQQQLPPDVPVPMPTVIDVTLSGNLDRLLTVSNLDTAPTALDASKTLTSTKAPLLGKAIKSEKIPTNEADVAGNANVSRECSMPFTKSDTYRVNVDPIQRQSKWKRHVRIVLLADIAVCCLMFGIWLLICKGFQCISAQRSD